MRMTAEEQAAECKFISDMWRANDERNKRLAAEAASKQKQDLENLNRVIATGLK